MSFRVSEKEYKRIAANLPQDAIHKTTQVPLAKIPDLTGRDYAKYWNVKVYIFDDGFQSEQRVAPGHGKLVKVFDSRREYHRYCELCLLQQGKKISGLERQKKLVIQPAFDYRGKRIRPIVYVADFYYVAADGTEVIEDVKALDQKTGKILCTEAFKLKWKLLMFKYPQYDFRLYGI